MGRRADAALLRRLQIVRILQDHPGLSLPERHSPDGERPAPQGKEAEPTHLARLRYFLEKEGQHWTLPTLAKDIAFLKEQRLLRPLAHRSGYYAGLAVLTRNDLNFLLNTLGQQVQHLKHPYDHRRLQQLRTRLERLEVLDPSVSYPISVIANHPIVNTSAEKHEADIFGQLNFLEEMILSGQAIQLQETYNPWQDSPDEQGSQRVTVYPLQLVFHDIAWYLLVEYAAAPHKAWLRAIRCDRLGPVILPTDTVRARSRSVQLGRLATATKLLEAGWDMNLGTPEEQQREIEGDQSLFQSAHIRFSKQLALFIQEGTRRHPTQRWQTAADGALLYQLTLPPRAIDGFRRWVLHYGAHAEVLAPPILRSQMASIARELREKYQGEGV